MGELLSSSDIAAAPLKTQLALADHLLSPAQSRVGAGKPYSDDDTPVDQPGWRDVLSVVPALPVLALTFGEYGINQVLLPWAKRNKGRLRFR